MFVAQNVFGLTENILVVKKLYYLNLTCSCKILEVIKSFLINNFFGHDRWDSSTGVLKFSEIFSLFGSLDLCINRNLDHTNSLTIVIANQLELNSKEGGPCILWFLVPKGNHEMQGSWIPGTVFSVKP